MSLTTEEIIGGMYRAHRAGQPFAALVANPQFANLPMEQKQKVLAGLRQRMGGETSSPVNALTSIVKGTAGGALAGLPLGVAVPMALEMSETGVSRKSVLAALKQAASNKNVKMLVGTGMTLGAIGGLVNSALSLRQAKIDHDRMQEDLEEASKGGEALAAASFGAIGGHGTARQVNLEPVIKTFRDTATPYVATSARFGHHAEAVEGSDPDRYNALMVRAFDKVNSGYSADPERLSALAKKLSKYDDNYAAMNSIIVNSPRELGIDPSDVDRMQARIQGLQAANQGNVNNINTLEQFARQVRDTKRGVQ